MIIKNKSRNKKTCYSRRSFLTFDRSSTKSKQWHIAFAIQGGKGGL